jgi:hypothetical protein
MLSWVIAALIGAVPLYFGFVHGRGRQGVPLWTSVGVLLTLSALGLFVATNAGAALLVTSGLLLAYVAGIGVLGTLAGGIATLALGPPGGGAGR